MNSPVLIKRIFSKINSQLIRNHGRQKQWDGILKGEKKKPKTVNQEFCIQQNYTSNLREKLRHLQINKNCESSLLVHLTLLKKNTKLVLQIEMRGTWTITQSHTKKQRILEQIIIQINIESSVTVFLVGNSSLFLHDLIDKCIKQYLCCCC